MAKVSKAKTSPRLVNGNIYFYEGDQFLLRLKLNIKDTAGNSFDVGTGSVWVSTYDDCGDLIEKFEAAADSDNIIEISFDESRTGLYRVGKYTMNVDYIVPAYTLDSGSTVEETVNSLAEAVKLIVE